MLKVYKRDKLRKIFGRDKKKTYSGWFNKSFTTSVCPFVTAIRKGLSSLAVGSTPLQFKSKFTISTWLFSDASWIAEFDKAVGSTEGNVKRNLATSRCPLEQEFRIAKLSFSAGSTPVHKRKKLIEISLFFLFFFHKSSGRFQKYTFWDPMMTFRWEAVVSHPNISGLCVAIRDSCRSLN